MKCEVYFAPLGDLVNFSSGGTPSKSNPEYWNGSIPWISAKTMKKEHISTSDLFITEEGLKHGSRIAHAGSLLLLTRGSGLFNTIPLCYVDEDVAFNQDVKCLTSKGEVDTEYIFYWLLSQSKYLLAKVGVTGIGAGKFDMDFLNNLPVRVPSQSERTAIVEFANVISEKIRVNERINDNLQQQAQALFANAFPYSPDDELPVGWRKGTVGDVVDIHDSKRIPLSGAQRDKMTKRTYPYYGAASLMDYVDEYIFDGIYLLLGEDGTVVDDSGYPVLQYVWGQFWVNNHAHILTGKNGYSVESLMLLFKRTPVKSIVTGAVQPKISQANLRSIPVVIPSADALAEFNALIAPMFEQIRQNTDQNKALAQLRDALLPKLMSGEIDVSDVRI